MDLQVVDNFLNSYNFSLIQSRMMGKDFPWFYSNDVVTSEMKGYDPKLFQFNHFFFGNSNIKSDDYSMLEPALEKLGVNKLMRVVGRLYPRNVFNRTTGYHVDYRNHPVPYTTVILYINTNNGGTKFKSGNFVKSVANRAVIFGPDLEHTAVTCTDEKTRVIINMNYE